VPSEERRDQVLRFLSEHDMALPPLAIYAGLRRQKNITFGYRTVQNALADLLEQDLVKRVDTVRLREDGRIEEVSEEGDKRRGYYFITDAGKVRVEGNT